MRCKIIAFQAISLPCFGWAQKRGAHAAFEPFASEGYEKFLSFVGMSYIPEPLKEGDCIALAAPARYCTESQADEVAEVLRSKGYEVLIPDGLFERDGQLAGSDTERADLLNQQMHNPAVKAILCMRGGYGSARLLPLLRIPESRVPLLCGFSDITALHAAFWAKGIASLHSPVGTTLLTASDAARERFFASLKGVFSPCRADAVCLQAGRARGPLVGGNLSVLYSLQGTPYFPKLDGAILLLEDVDEMLYHLDRMLTNFELAGVFDRISGLLIGQVSDMRDNIKACGFESDNPFGYGSMDIVRRFVKGRNIPVCFGFPVGHENENMSLLLGDEVFFEVSEEESRLTWSV